MKNLVIAGLSKKSSFEGLKNLAKRNFTLTILLLIATISGYGQNSRVVSVTDLVKNQIQTESNLKNTETISKIKSFLHDLKPSVYVNKQVVNSKSNSPLCLYTDVQSVKSITTLGISTASIEFVSIKVKSRSELSAPIDLSIFNEFSNLKYIVLVFEYTVTQSDAERAVTNASENQYVLYKVEIQS